MKRCLILLAILAGQHVALAQGNKRLALVIGNSHYTNGGTLKNPVNDARAIASTLQSFGFEVMEYEDVTQPQMKQAINSFGTKLKGYHVGLFYYAGHGIQSKGVNYMIPVEVDLKNEESVEYDCVAADRVLAFMETAAAKVNLIILDACRNNPFERSWARSVDGNGLALMRAPKGSLIAYATAPGSTASDGEASNGLYTSALLKYIRNSNLTIEQVFKQVRNEVSDKSGGAQIPWETTSLTGDDFYLAKGTALTGASLIAANTTTGSGSTKARELNLNAKVTPENKAQAEIYLNQAKLNYDGGQFDKAIAGFEKAIRLNPAYDEAFYWRAMSYYSLKNYDKAVEDFSAVIEITPKYTEAYYWRGNAHFGVRQDEKAIDDYSKAIAQRPDYTEAYYWRGRTYYELVKDEKAMSDLTRAIQLRADYAEPYYWRGKVHYENKRYDDAIKDFTTAMTLNPNDSEAAYWRANSWFTLKNYQSALDDFGTAIRIKPTYAEAYLYRGKVRYNMKTYNEALEDFRRAVEYRTDYVDGYYWQGVTLYVLKLYDPAIEALTKALDLNPRHADALYYRAMSKYSQQKDEDAILDLDRSIEVQPAADAYYWRALAKYNMQDFADAIPDLSKAIELDPTGSSSANYYYWRGNSYYSLKMDSYAVKDFTTAVAMKPDFADAWYYRACSNFYQGFKDQSLSDLNKAISLDPNNTKYTDFKSKNFH